MAQISSIFSFSFLIYVAMFAAMAVLWIYARKCKAAEDKLRISEDRFHLAIFGSNDGIWDWNVRTDHTYFSPQFKSLLGYDEGEIGENFSEWSGRLHPQDKEPVLELLQAHFMIRKDPYDVEYRLRTKTGGYRWFRTKGKAVWDKDGKPIRMAGSISDVTVRKQIELQLKEYTAKMEKTNVELEALRKEAETMNIELILANEQAQADRIKADEATRLKSEFLANMSHEIRTPMNGIIGMSNLLLDFELGITERGYTQTIINSAEALLQIINDILDFSKIEAGKIDLEIIPFNLRVLCEDVCEMMALRAGEKNIDLLLRYPQQAPKFCLGDPGRVRQILFNLLNNAIKFTSGGHVLLSMNVSLQTDGRMRVYAEVEDTGMGIPEDKVDLIFNKFGQADQSTARKFGGTGLGLSICRELTRLMDGSIGVRSVYGQGSVFWFEIYLKENASSSSEIAVADESALRGLRVLVVDDNKVARTIMREQLASYEVQIVEASSGEECLDLLQKDPNFDVGVLDYIMDGMDGEELARRLKTDPKTSSIPLVMVTSAPNRGDKKHMEEIGFSAYFSKPMTQHSLRSTLATIAKYRRSNQKIPMITQYNLKEGRFETPKKGQEDIHFDNAQILLVEDNPVNMIVATSMLEKYGCRVTPAADGSEAIEVFKERRFDLILMDCQMHVMDGYEATKVIREWEESKKIQRTPIVAFTASALKTDQEKCLGAGMDDYIPKPVRDVDMERALTAWLSKAKDKGSHKKITSVIAESTDVSGDLCLDIDTFTQFSDLMGDTLPFILQKHFDVAQGYLQSILDNLSIQDFTAVSKAAHPLKSSNLQIGAVRMAHIASDIEHAAKEDIPDPNRLKNLVDLAVLAQTELRQQLGPHFEHG